MKITRYIVLILLLLAGVLQMNAQKDTADIKQLTKDMYRYFSSDKSEEFFKTIELLKARCLATNNERLFYKAWSNEAIYTFLRVNRKKGIEKAQEVNQYAREHDSKFGLYTSTYVLGTIRSSGRNEELAKKSFLQAIEYQHQYFPRESAAAPYLGLCKIAFNNKDYAKVLDYAQKTLAEPNVIALHQVTAWSYKCMVYFAQNDTANFERTYKERKAIVDKHGHDDSFGTLITSYRYRMNGQLDEALKQTEKMSLQTRTAQKAAIYEKMGDYKQAYYWLRKYKSIGDSILSQEVRAQMNEFDTELSIAQAENESKDLRLANQQLQLAHVTDELQQRKLEAESAELKLKNADIELANAAIQMENDSLERSEQAAKLREQSAKMNEYRSKMEAQQQAQHTHRIMAGAVITVALLTIAFLVFYLYRRQHQMKRLEHMNQQLQTAYDHLEEATAARERIESELRIARDIQMGMVPHVFPDRPDLDIFAMMTPAKAVGGDLYNYVLQDDMLYFCVGDVSGKGVPASLFMAEVSRMFRTLVDGNLKPDVIATRLNHALTENNEQGMFVTMFIGLIDLSTGHLDFCNAGHNPPLLDGQFMEIEPNAPIGLWPGLEYVGEEVESLRGKTLFIYTDGLNEAENIRQEQFGDDRLQELLTHDWGNARETSEHVHAAVERFVGDAEPSDDITKMCIKVH